ncbi:MAG: hypothetical protein ACFE78_01000 [Candidatus Hodarchaeota archaeon]
MSKLFKLRLSLILLIVGIGLIPTAFLAKGYFQDQVPANVPETLLKLKNEGISYVEQEFKGLCIPDLVPLLVEEKLIEIEEDIAKVRDIPKFLRFIRSELINSFPSIINGSKAAGEINNVISLVQTQNSTSLEIARNKFFNNYTFQDNYSTPIEGISERMMGSVSLNYSDIAQARILEGYTYNGTPYPGITTDTRLGEGINDWLEFYSLAESDPGNQSLMEQVYNCSWTSGQLQNLSAYIKSYLWNTVVKNYYDSKGITDPTEFEFCAQWANLSFYMNYINLDYFSEVINQTLFPYEAATILAGIIITPTGISFSSAKDLWNSTNPLSFVNDTGFLTWLNASTDASYRPGLTYAFSITYDQVLKILTWLFSPVKENIVPNLIKYPQPYGYGMNTTEYSKVLFYEQWANGTVVEDGLVLHIIGNITYKGIEAGIPTKTNISLEATRALFDETNTSSFINRYGILKWIEASEGDVTVQNELISKFKLNIVQINLTNNWLFSTLRYDVLPYISFRYPLVKCMGVRRTTLDYAEIEFYRQWANGSIFTEGIDIAPFLLLESPIKNFEAGIPTLNCTQSKLLWDEDNYYSFVNPKGISIWYEALGFPNHRNTLKSSTTNFNLTDSELNSILDWLIYVRDNLTLQYTLVKNNLPANYYILADWYFMGMMIGAIGFSSVGLIVGVIVIMFQKKR